MNANQQVLNLFDRGGKFFEGKATSAQMAAEIGAPGPRSLSRLLGVLTTGNILVRLGKGADGTSLFRRK